MRTDPCIREFDEVSGITAIYDWNPPSLGRSPAVCRPSQSPVFTEIFNYFDSIGGFNLFIQGLSHNMFGSKLAHVLPCILGKV